MRQNLCCQSPWALWSSEILRHCAGSLPCCHGFSLSLVLCHKSGKTGGCSNFWSCPSGYWFLFNLGVEYHFPPIGSYWCLLVEGTLVCGDPVLIMVTLGSGCRVAYRIWLSQRYYWFGWVWYFSGIGCWIRLNCSPFSNNTQTALMAASWELHGMVSIYLRAAGKKCMALFYLPALPSVESDTHVNTLLCM